MFSAEYIGFRIVLISIGLFRLSTGVEHSTPARLLALCSSENIDLLDRSKDIHFPDLRAALFEIAAGVLHVRKERGDGDSARGVITDDRKMHSLPTDGA